MTTHGSEDQGVLDRLDSALVRAIKGAIWFPLVYFPRQLHKSFPLMVRLLRISLSARSLERSRFRPRDVPWRGRRTRGRGGDIGLDRARARRFPRGRFEVPKAHPRHGRYEEARRPERGLRLKAVARSLACPQCCRIDHGTGLWLARMGSATYRLASRIGSAVSITSLLNPSSAPRARLPGASSGPHPRLGWLFLHQCPCYDRSSSS